ncbi:hypothetical protein os1_44200 [Comamonadaceae bacterium OS-1]|nr:hypothetical protein os1_44200 [Comamonadaceae bacterium OS-1]
MSSYQKESVFRLGTDFVDKEVDAVKIIAASLQLATAAQLNALLHTEVLKEICHV